MSLQYLLASLTFVSVASKSASDVTDDDNHTTPLSWLHDSVVPVLLYSHINGVIITLALTELLTQISEKNSRLQKSVTT